MLLSAIAADDPAVVIEHRSLYFGRRAEVSVDGPIAAVGGARVRRAGSDVTLVTWGAMLGAALEAAALLDGEGLSVEVIDARWLAPFDTATVVESVEKTGRLVIAHEANVSGGFGAEIAARIANEALWSLEAPIARVGVPDLRIPAAPVLQAAGRPGRRADRGGGARDGGGAGVSIVTKPRRDSTAIGGTLGRCQAATPMSVNLLVV